MTTSTAAPTYRTRAGQPVPMGQLIGQGGEGAVYHLSDPNKVAKIWHPDQRAPETIKKLQLMVTQRPKFTPAIPGPQLQSAPPVCWPDQLLYDHNNQPVGYVMDKLDPSRHHDTFHYFNPAARNNLETKGRGSRITDLHLYTIARNLSNAVNALHQADYVIGDVNEKNILVNHNFEVTIVDADSFQVTDPATRTRYRCTKGRDEYTPPRMQGKTFRDHDRTEDDDNFGLAVIIFKLLMHGVHPYASTGDPNAQTNISLAEKIKLQYFPYNESGHTPPQHQPSRTYQNAWQDLDFETRHLFRRAFDPQATASRSRPTADEWTKYLNHLILNPPPQRKVRASAHSQSTRGGAFGASAKTAAPAQTRGPGNPGRANQPRTNPNYAPNPQRQPAYAGAPSTAGAARAGPNMMLVTVIIAGVIILILIIVIATMASGGNDREDEQIIRYAPTATPIPLPTNTLQPVDGTNPDPKLIVDFDATPEAPEPEHPYTENLELYDPDLYVDFEDTPEP